MLPEVAAHRPQPNSSSVDSLSPGMAQHAMGWLKHCFIHRKKEDISRSVYLMCVSLTWQVIGPSQ